MSIEPARSDVFAEERQEYIARLVEEHGRARVTDLSSQFGVSSVTIRKDLEKLEQQGRLTRTHGGAVAPTRPAPSAGSTSASACSGSRRTRSAARPRRWSSTARASRSTRARPPSPWRATSRRRGGWLHLTVITNGLRIAAELAGHPGITVAMPGGSPLGGPEPRRPAGRGPVRQGQHPDGVHGRGRVRHRRGPVGRDRRGGADQAPHGRARAARSRPRRPQQVGAGGVRHVLPDRRPRRRGDRRPGARRDARRRAAAGDRGPPRLAGRRRRAHDAPARPGGARTPW